MVLHRVGGAGVHRQLSAGAALLETASFAALAGSRERTVRNRTGRTGPGRLRAAAGLDRRAAGDSPLICVHAGLFKTFVHGGYRNERLAPLLDDHERPFRWFGGVILTCLYDNPRTLVLGRNENKV